MSSQGIENAKEMIAPKNTMTIEHETFASELYKKSHNAFAPGEQKHRNYFWRVKPEEFRFGLAEKRVRNGVANAIHTERSEEAFPKTVIVRKE